MLVYEEQIGHIKGKWKRNDGSARSEFHTPGETSVLLFTERDLQAFVLCKRHIDKDLSEGIP